MSEIPHYPQDRCEDDLREFYRSLRGNALINNLVETMLMRRQQPLR